MLEIKKLMRQKTFLVDMGNFWSLASCCLVSLLNNLEIPFEEL